MAVGPSLTPHLSFYTWTWTVSGSRLKRRPPVLNAAQYLKAGHPEILLRLPRTTPTLGSRSPRQCLAADHDREALRTLKHCAL